MKKVKKNTKGTESEKELIVVGIGASAGGLEAIQRLFDNLPTDTGMAFIIIQHLSPDFKSLMPELLAKHTKMQIFTAEDKQTIQPNCVYLNQRNKNLHIKGRELYLLDKGPKHNLNLPIDIFFHTLGEEYKEKSVGVILSGTGSDGSRGIKTIKEAGGDIIVQDPITAQFDGMPNSAIATNLVDYILPPEKIIEALFKYPNKRLEITEDGQDKKSNDVIFYNILEEVQKTSGIDFRLYKRNTLVRRLEKRMNINNIDELYDYLTFLKSNFDEKESLKQDFLIGVTSFFRDTEAFESLKTNVIPEICKNKKDTDPIRIWAPGCSTGEETYSLAILLDEHIRANKYKFDYKIFATDVDSIAINTAGTGSFQINIGNEVEKEYLERYFINSGEKMQIIKRIREKIVFSNHNILKDPPFIRMDLITCRNMLIYFDNKAQARIMHNFQFALNKFGYLFLGNSESLGVVSKLFKTIDAKWKIYQNISDTKHIQTSSSPDNKITTFPFKPSNQIITQPEYRFKENPETVFHKYLSKKHSPASIFIDADYNLLFIKGDAGKRLSHSEGMFQNNLLKMVNPEVSSIIRNSIRRLEKEKKDIFVQNIVNKNEDQLYTFDLSFHKPTNFDNLHGIYLIQFSEEKEIEKDSPIILQNLPIDEISKQRFEDLENELKATKIELQNVVEELETSNEELQSSNEELMASNEELQSTNEELQSVNEELYTVNSELQQKNNELQTVNDDTSNLLDSTKIGTLFLNSDLRIRKFTPALQSHFKLKEEDIGRPISSFAGNFSDTIRMSLIEDSKQALNELITIEKEAKDNDGNCFLIKINPFITIDKKIDGVVISFVGINELKKIEEQIRISENKYRELFENMAEGFAHAKIITDDNNKPIDWEYITVNPAFEKLTGINAVDIVGKSITKVLPSLIDDDSIDWLTLYGETALTGKEHYIEVGSTPLEKHYVVHTFSPRKGEWAATFLDITERKVMEQNLILEKQFSQKISETSPNGIYIYDINKGVNVFMNKRYEELLGYSAEEMQEMTQDEFMTHFHPDEIDLVISHMEAVASGKENDKLEYRFKHKDGHWIWLYSIDTPFEKNADGTVVSMLGSFWDLSEKIQFEKQLAKYNEELNKVQEIAHIGSWYLDLITNEVTWSDELYKMYGFDPKLPVPPYSEHKKLFIKESWELLSESLDKTVKTSEPYELELKTLRKNGSNGWMWVRGEVIKNEYEETVALWGAAQDISKQKEIEEDLKIAKKEAESANIHKNYFLANMSHEIRTPMNGVIGFSSLLKDDNLSKETKNKYLEIIDGNSLQLLKLIDDIIDVAKIESNELKITLNDCNLSKLLNDVYDNFNQIKVKLKKEQIELKLEIPEDYQNLIIKTDSARLQQVISNLVNNSLKFSEKGLIRFGFTIDNSIINFFVVDEGIGIPENKITEIFERFKQINYENAAKYGGTGLGLPICKGIIELLGGHITVVSKLKKGSSFTFTIPLTEVNEIQTPVKHSLSSNLKSLLDNKTFLIVDDDEVIRFYFKEVFKPYNIKIIFAENGQEAIDFYFENDNIDLVFMDLRMPELSGYKATETIINKNPKAKIIAQTAYAMPEEKEKCLNAGFIGYISKPIDISLLFKTILNWI